MVAGEIVGFDAISRPEAYAKLHLKLLKSYLIDALTEPKPDQIDPIQAHDKARSFLEETAAGPEQTFPSVGYGQDCRYQNPELAGTALVVDQHVVHTAFFRMKSAAGPTRL